MDILSMTADIFTIIGIIIAAVTLINYYREKKKNLEYEVKKYFFDGTTWEFLEGKSDTNSNTAHHFSLHITNANFHSFVGEIKILEPDGTDSQPMDEAILFQFIGMNQGKISISIMKATGSSKKDLSVTHLGTAILEYENPQLFKIVFHESSLSKLPHTAFIMTKLISAPNSSNTQDIP